MDYPYATKWLNIYRKKNNKHTPIPGPEIEIVDVRTKYQRMDDYEFIAHCSLEPAKNYGMKFTIITPSVYKDKAKDTTNEKEKTNSSVDSIGQKEEEPYCIVSRSSMSNNNTQGGHPLSTNFTILEPGMTLKLGRI